MRDSRRAWLVASCILVVALAVGLSAVNPPAATARGAAPTVVESFGKLPLYFIENRGQLDERVAYYVQGRDKAIYFTSDGVTYALTKEVSSKVDEAADSRGLGGALRTVGFRSRPETAPSIERWAVKAEFVDANSARATPSGSTQSSEATFPLTVAPNLTYNGGGDAFVAKIGERAKCDADEGASTFRRHFGRDLSQLPKDFTSG